VGVVTDGGERVFLNTAVVGAYPAVIRLRERMRPYMGIWPAALVAGLWVWGRWPRFDLVISTRDHRLERRTAMLWIGTGPGSFPAPHEAPVAESGDGLELVILPSARRRHALRLPRALWASRHGRGPESVGLEVLRAPTLEIESHHRVRLTLDAEPHVLVPPVRVTLEPDALRVVCAPQRT
jgi:diacylglycerol kinase family enzyme